MNTNDKMVYRGKPELVHIADGQRNAMGQGLADTLEFRMRQAAASESEPMEERAAAWTNPLCPGCYMVAGFDMLVALAEANGQSLSELGRTMAAAFTELENCPSYGEACRESITVLLDPEDDAEPQAHGYVMEDRDSLPITHDHAFDSSYGLDPYRTITIDNTYLKETR